MPSLASHKILIIDDHPETLNIIEKVLQQQGYQVVGARSGIQGLALAKSEQPDLILLDGMMPEMDGWEVCRRLRATPDLAQIPIIMFSAVDEAERKLAGFDAGADDYLTKPTEPPELIERVQEMLASVTPRTAKPAEPSAAPIMTETMPQDNRHTGTINTPLAATMTLPSNSNLIAVVGARGGAGATTLAINIAVSLAHNENKVLLVDLDLKQGHVGLYLNQKEFNGLPALLQQPLELWESSLSQHVQRYNARLQLLLAEPNFEDEITLSPDQLQTLLTTAASPGRSIVIDCGHEVTAVTRALIQKATDVLICLRPERVALAAGKQMIHRLQPLLDEDARLRAVMFDFSGATNVPKNAIERFLSYPLATIIPITPQEMNLAVNKSVPLVELNPQAKASVRMRQLAQQLVKV